MIVHLSLSVHDIGSTPMRETRLWVRDMETPQAPAAGQRVHLWADGPLQEIGETYWEADGAIWCEFAPCIVDPDWNEQAHWRGRHDDPKCAWFWWVNSEGERPESLLREYGWRPYLEVLHEREA